MRTLIEWVGFIGGLVSIAAPLMYAVGTLAGMQHKMVYPIFRFVKRHGCRLPVENVFIRSMQR